MLDDPYRQSECLVDWPHPLGVAPGQIIVDRDHMDPLPDETVEVDWQRCDQGFSFAGFHLSYFPLVEDDTTNELDVEMSHVAQTS